MYPIMLDVRDRLVVIVGGGAVAARKAKGLLDAGARRVRVVAPDVRASFDPPVQILLEEFLPDHLIGAHLVFAATDSTEVNDCIVHAARERGVLVCRVDSTEAAPGDFTTPAVHRRHPLTIAVAALNPRLSVAMRDRIAELVDSDAVSR